MNINIFTIGIILILLMFLVVGWKNGVVKETASFIGIVIVFFLSYALKGIVGNFLCSIFPFFELKELISLNILIYHGIAFILLFVLLLGLYKLLLKLSNALQKLINYTIILIIPSKVLGALISLLEGWIIVFIILLVLIVPFKDVKEFKDSKMANIVLFNTPVLSNKVKPFTTGVVEIYNLSSKISMEEISKNEANLKSLDIMLKYKLVDRKTVERLVKTKKLDKIENIESILNKY